MLPFYDPFRLIRRTSLTVPTNNQVLVPETLLKKRKSQEQARAVQREEAQKKKEANKQKRATIFKRAESYVKEYRDAEREKIRLGRVARKDGNFQVEDEAKLVFVIRIKGYVLSSTLHGRITI
ncbi:60S ribosomal protein L7 [Aspergillus melleus]|uniref:60S ribosomal protein L7 n=1 Tax=Aspergillus melleus TaxID=138277 RepID=A0ACC3AX45_9EURO|nr:60S ribosomal protein L7 [Aspergillus melleus]